jgi:phage tail P2-like protein
MNRGITKENLLFVLPSALKADESTEALGEAAAELLAGRVDEIDRLRIISNIDELPAGALAILARDFKVDWWDPNYTLTQKRQTVKDSWKVHKTLGTRGAVETALRAVFPGAQVKEWFQYGGEPYCFRVEIPIPEDGVTAQQQRRMLERMRYYKSLRSHLDCVEYQTETEGAARAAAFVSARMTVEVWPELVTALEITDRTGNVAASRAKETVEVFPALTERLEVSAQAGPAAITAGRQTVEIFPSLTERLDIQTESRRTAGTAAKQVVEIFPDNEPGGEEETQ